MSKQTPTRTRKQIAELIKKHSPVKKNVVMPVVIDEDKPLCNANEIVKGLWVGNYLCAKDKKFFEKHKIKAVLNCTKDLSQPFASSGVEYMRIPVDDSLKEKDFKLMLHYFPVITEFIHKHHVIEKHNILVHCWAGRQRSAASVVAYLMKYYRLKPHQGIKYVISKRPEAFHFGKSINFDVSMDKYYDNIQKKKHLQKT